VFEHPNPSEWDIYCSYCPELIDFSAHGKNVKEVVECIERHLKEELQNRIAHRTLIIKGWEVSKNSAIPPIFTNEEALKLTEKLFEIDIPGYQIFELHAELPPAKQL
jgi:hypothetical protein